MYVLAWRKGLKTTYYLRGQAATQIEKSTMDANRHGIQPRWMKNTSASARVPQNPAPEADRLPPGTNTTEIPACLLENPDCEACQ